MTSKSTQGPQSRVLIAGASGYIGQMVVQRALKRGHQVRAVMRPSSQVKLGEHPNLTCHYTDLDPLTGWTAPLPKADAVISCLASRTGTPKDAHLVDYQMNRALLTHAEQSQVQHFIMLSAICVQKPKLAFQLEKLRFEADLQASPLTHSIVRPTAFFKSLSGQIKRVQSGKPYLYFGTGQDTACTPISERDLADFMLECLDLEARHNKILPIGGPHPALTPQDIGHMMFETFDRPVKMRSVSPRIFTILGKVLGVLAPFSKTIRDKCELMKIGHYYATESMLIWDQQQNSYCPVSTPSTGQDTLKDYFQSLHNDHEIETVDTHSQIY